MKGKELHSLTANIADALTGEVASSVIADGFCWPNSDDGTSEDKSKEERKERAASELDVTRERARLEGRLDASSQETLKANEELKITFRRWEQEILEQRRMLAGQKEEVTRLHRENQKSRELITQLQSRVGQVVELGEIVRESKIMIGKLRQEVNSLCSIREGILDSEVRKTMGQLYREKHGLNEDLCKCQIQLELAKQDLNVKTSELEQMKDNVHVFKEATHKLEQKIENIQQQLILKHRAGQNGPYTDGLQTPSLLKSTAKEMFYSIATLTSLLSHYKNPGGHNPVHSSIVESDLWKRAPVIRDHHWTYVLKHFICLRLFENFQSETFAPFENDVLFLNHEERVRQCFEYFEDCRKRGAVDRGICHTRKDNFDFLFFKYLASRSSLLLPTEIHHICELFKNHDELTRDRLRELLSPIPIHNQKLVQSLISAVEKVWQFHKLCLSFEPPATMFRVWTGGMFDQDYMHGIDVQGDDDSNVVPKVGFMVYPGFRLQKFIIKCEVYPAFETTSIMS